MKSHLHVLVAIVLLLGFAACQEREAKSQQQAPPQTAEPAPQAQTTEMRDLDRGPAQHVIYRPDEVQWQDGPDAFEPGTQFAVLEGDPAASGVFTAQIKLPAGFVINPHWHPNVERVTVLKGMAYLGSGEQVNKETAEALPAGTYTAMPPKMVHHVITEGETIVQLTTVGPWEINYVNPQHDPRKRKSAPPPRAQAEPQG